MTRTEIRFVIHLCSIMALRLMGLFMMVPLFSVYALRYQDATPMTVGIAMGIYGAFQALLHIPFGYLSDRFGRKPLLLLSLVLFVLGSLVGIFAQDIQGLIVARLIQGLGAMGGVSMAWLADGTRAEVRTQAMAILGMSIGIAFSLSLMTGAFITTFVGGLSGVFGVAFCFGLVALLSLYWLPSYPSQQAFTSDSTHLWHYRTYLGAVCLVHCVLAANFLIIPVQLDTYFYVPAEWQWPYMLSVLLISFLPTLYISRRLDKSQKVEKILLKACLFMILGQLGMLLGAQHFMVWLFSMSLFFMGINWLEAGLPSLLSRQVSPAHRGRVMGAYSTSQFLGIFLGGILSGWLYGQFQISAVSYACILVLAGLWLWIKTQGFVTPRQTVIYGKESI